MIAAGPSSPTNISITARTDDSLTFSWEEPACETTEGIVREYRYVFGEPPFSGPYNFTDKRQITFKNLKCGNEYQFKVSAITDGGAGPFSKPKTETFTQRKFIWGQVIK